MSKTFVLAEKPSVGRELGRVLGCPIKKDGYMEGNKYVVSWALGHLVELADPQDYDKRLETWDMQDLPMLPDKMQLKVISQTAKQYKLVKSLLHRGDIRDIVIATDAGREGELVARWILEKAGVRKPMKRLWISSQTDKAIKEGFAHLKDAREYEPLYRSAVCRAEADWLVGLNTTRALTCKFNAQLSAGRVQTPTLAMIVDREAEIRKFVPKEYFTLRVDAGAFVLDYRKNNNASIMDRKQAETLMKQLKHKQITIQDVERKRHKEQPPQLYDLTELQRDANQRFGFSAKETLNYMQSLYETHKLLTYPRTDSRYLSQDIVGTLKERLQAICIDVYEPRIHAVCEHMDFYASGRIMISDGWRALYQKNERFDEDEEQDDDQNLPSLAKGQQYPIRDVRITSHFTKAPARYTEATLLSAMEHPSKFISNSRMKAVLEDANGIGTVATRADIIEKLFKTNYIEKRGNSIYPLSKGIQLVSLVPEELRSPLLTATWEEKLTAISKGKLKDKSFMKEMRSYASDLVEKVKNSEASYRHDNMTQKKCPECGSNLLEINGKRGKLLACSSPSCKYKQNLSFTSNARCPKCHKKLNVVGEKEKRLYTCVCGFREKFDRFNEQLKEKRNVAGRAELQDFNKKQEAEKKQEKSAFQLAWEAAQKAKE